MQKQLVRLTYIITGLLISLSGMANPLLNPDVDEDEYFSETYTIFADLNNGAYIFGQLGVSNIGPGDKRGLCRILVVLPEGKVFNQSIIVNQEDWSFSNSNNQILQVKNCRLESSHKDKTLAFTGEIKKQKIHILLHALAKKIKMPHDLLLLKSGYYKSDILIPWATATVIYQLNAQKKVESMGFGYADHSRSTLLPAKLAHQWVRFRALNPNNSKIILARQATEGKPFEGWLWWQEASKAELFKELTLSESIIKNVLHWNIVFYDQAKRYEIKTKKPLLRYAPMEETGVVTKMLSYIVGNPVTYTYRSTLITPDGTEIPGILEVAKIDGN